MSDSGRDLLGAGMVGGGMAALGAGIHSAAKEHAATKATKATVARGGKLGLGLAGAAAAAKILAPKVRNAMRAAKARYRTSKGVRPPQDLGKGKMYGDAASYASWRKDPASKYMDYRSWMQQRTKAAMWSAFSDEGVKLALVIPLALAGGTGAAVVGAKALKKAQKSKRVYDRPIEYGRY